MNWMLQTALLREPLLFKEIDAAFECLERGEIAQPILERRE